MNVTSDITRPAAKSGIVMRMKLMPPAFIAVISLSPESRWIASSVPSKSAIGKTSPMSPGSDQMKISIAAHSGM